MPPLVRPYVGTVYVSGTPDGPDTAFTNIIVSGAYHKSTQRLARGQKLVPLESKVWRRPVDLTLSCLGIECSKRGQSETECSGKVSLAESIRRIHGRCVAGFTCFCKNHLDEKSYAWTMHCTDCVKEDKTPLWRASIRLLQENR